MIMTAMAIAVALIGGTLVYGVLKATMGLRLDQDDRIALLGRNGEGKSTLLRLISGDLTPDSGDIARAVGLKVARLSQKVPEVPREAAKTENPLAFPSKSIKSCHCFSVNWSLYCNPFPVLKYSPIAFSPE